MWNLCDDDGKLLKNESRDRFQYLDVAYILPRWLTTIASRDADLLFYTTAVLDVGRMRGKWQPGTGRKSESRQTIARSTEVQGVSIYYYSLITIRLGVWYDHYHHSSAGLIERLKQGVGSNWIRKLLYRTYQERRQSKWAVSHQDCSKKGSQRSYMV